MLFSSPLFLFRFLPVVLLGHLLLPHRLRNAWLLGASLFFYAWGEGTTALVMVISITGNFVLGKWAARGRESRSARIAVGLAVLLGLGLLVAYKYANFLADTVNALTGPLGLPALDLPPVALPIGISFFTFQAMSYVLDVYREEAEVRERPSEFALYIALFPQLIAGPIVRYRDVAAQLADRTVNRAGFAEGVRRFAIGLGKKVLIADTLSGVCDPIIDELDPAHWTAALAWLAMVSYALQIYFDFSGYSDMAIGLGRMLGFRFLENFQWPYISRSLTEFWRRWHISLSSWFRDYLYIPLGGNRGGRLQTYRNLVIVFLLCGLWHGASWSFVIWGLFHGAFLVIERTGLGRLLERLPASLRHAYLLLVVLSGWVLFRIEELPRAGQMFAALWGAGTGDGFVAHTGLYLTSAEMLALAAGVVGSVPWLPRVRAWRDTLAERGATVLAGTLDLAGALAGTAVLLAAVARLAASTSSPFIYFRF